MGRATHCALSLLYPLWHCHSQVPLETSRKLLAGGARCHGQEEHAATVLLMTAGLVLPIGHGY